VQVHFQLGRWCLSLVKLGRHMTQAGVTLFLTVKLKMLRPAVKSAKSVSNFRKQGNRSGRTIVSSRPPQESQKRVPELCWRYVAVGGACAASIYFLVGKAGTSPEVIWSRANPTPWNTVGQHETTNIGNKLGPRVDASGNPHHHIYTERWNRWKSAARAREGQITSYERVLKQEDTPK